MQINCGMPNRPYLDARTKWRIETGQIEFREPSYREVCETIVDSGLASEVVCRIGAGKEADVYFCRYNGAPLAVKWYRLYRTSHRGGGPIKVDSLGWLAAREFEFLHMLWKRGVRVPTPARRVENAFSMRWLGDGNGAAPRLIDLHLEEPESMRAKVLALVGSAAAAGVVHTDLSPYNILIHQDEPWFIDLAEGLRVDRLERPPWVRLREAETALQRGLESLRVFFAREGAGFDPQPLVAALMARIDRGGLLQGRERRRAGPPGG